MSPLSLNFEIASINEKCVLLCLSLIYLSSCVGQVKENHNNTHFNSSFFLNFSWRVKRKKIVKKGHLLISLDFNVFLTVKKAIIKE